LAQAKSSDPSSHQLPPAMQHLPQLPEHEVCVVNTFVEFRDVNKKKIVERASTAPAKTLDALLDVDAEDSPEEGIDRSQRRLQTVAAVKDGKKLEARQDSADFYGPIDSDYEEEEHRDHEVEKEVQVTPSYHKMTTPEPWDIDRTLSEVRKGAAKLIERQESDVGSQPSLRRITTPDIWDRRMIEEKALNAEPPRVQVQQPQQLPQSQLGSGLPQAFSVPTLLLVPPMMCPMMPVTPQSFQQESALPMRSTVRLEKPCCQEQPGPRLLGRTSPSPTARRDEKKPDSFKALGPGALECVSENGLERICWNVDGAKLQSNAEKVLSPEFQLVMPGVGPQQFRLIIQATETGGKHGAGFKKARGQGCIFAKCLSSVAEGAPRATLRVTVGRGARARTEVVEHQFSDKSCCDFQKTREEWDLKSAIHKASKCFEILMEVEYASE